MSESTIHLTKEQLQDAVNIALFRHAFSAALRWLTGEIAADAHSDDSLAGMNYDNSYLADMDIIRRARRAMEGK